MRSLLCLGWLALAACSVSSTVNSHTPTPALPESTPIERRDPATPTTPPSHPTAIPTNTVSNPPSPAKLLVTSYPGSLVEGEIPAIVYLPKGFEEMGGQIPVIYLLHGLGYDEWMWVDLDVWAWVEQRPVVLIMPFIPQPLLSQTDGGPNSYETELLSGVIPHLEARFGLEPPHRAIAGISRGAVWALEISFRHPSEFEAVAALSPSLHLNRPRPDYDPRHIVAEGGPLPQQILLMAGEAERQTLAALELLVAELDAREASYRLEIQPGNHNEALWRGQLEEVLAILTAEG